jgi:hypothetical protein
MTLLSACSRRLERETANRFLDQGNDRHHRRFAAILRRQPGATDRLIRWFRT